MGDGGNDCEYDPGSQLGGGTSGQGGQGSLAAVPVFPWSVSKMF